jgi:hypothetical protein
MRSQQLPDRRLSSVGSVVQLLLMARQPCSRRTTNAIIAVSVTAQR